jgi:tRNA(Ser,Leu) C12 N-acetylase TAN1
VVIKLGYNANEDEVLEWLNDLTEGRSEQSFIGWAERVEELANQRCNENENVRVRIRHRGKVGLDFEISDRDALECVINAIKKSKDRLITQCQGQTR